MRRFLSILVAIGLIGALAAPVAATHAGVAHTVTVTSITTDCFTNLNGSVTITATITATGTVTYNITLMGNVSGEGGTYVPIQTQVAGPGNDTVTFTLTAAQFALYQSFRVDSTSAFASPTKSLSFNRSTCIDIIPESPLGPVLLVLTGGLAAAWFVGRKVRFGGLQAAA